MTKREIEEKLQELRGEWQRFPDKRNIIEVRAKLLKIALEEKTFQKKNQGSL